MTQISADSDLKVKGLVSILIYNYQMSHLADCLDSILNQKRLVQYEIIVMDDATNDGSWDIALDYAHRFNGKISLNRNKVATGEELNKRKGLLMCKGEYSVELTQQTPFDVEYIINIINQLQEDPFYNHFYISRLKTHSIFQPLFNPIRKQTQEDRNNYPLVTVCIFNYNYGRYLTQCIQSVLEQTYPNIEICFSDNASEDDSWKIATEFEKLHPDKFSLSRNRINMGAVANMWNCVVNMRGKYLLKLCSDDAIRPDFIEKCIGAFRQYPEIAFTMVHRDIMDDMGKVTSEPAFYDQSCFIPGDEQAAVYMMSSVNPSISQIMYNIELMQDKRMSGNLNDRWLGDRIMDFHICCESPIVYLKEPLLLNRVHQNSDSASMDANILQCLGEYVLVHQLSDIAATYHGMEKASQRLPQALEKLSKLSIRYCLRRLFINDLDTAKRYFHFAVVADVNIESDPTFILLKEYWASSENRRNEIYELLRAQSKQSISRQSSYAPPDGSIPYISVEESYVSH